MILIVVYPDVQLGSLNKMIRSKVWDRGDFDKLMCLSVKDHLNYSDGESTFPIPIKQLPAINTLLQTDCSINYAYTVCDS